MDDFRPRPKIESSGGVPNWVIALLIGAVVVAGLSWAGLIPHWPH